MWVTKLPHRGLIVGCQKSLVLVDPLLTDRLLHGVYQLSSSSKINLKAFKKIKFSGLVLSSRSLEYFDLQSLEHIHRATPIYHSAGDKSLIGTLKLMGFSKFCQLDESQPVRIGSLSVTKLKSSGPSGQAMNVIFKHGHMTLLNVSTTDLQNLDQEPVKAHLAFVQHDTVSRKYIQQISCGFFVPTAFDLMSPIKESIAPTAFSAADFCDEINKSHPRAQALVLKTGSTFSLNDGALISTPAPIKLSLQKSKARAKTRMNSRQNPAEIQTCRKEIEDYIEKKFFNSLLSLWGSSYIQPYRKYKLKWSFQIQMGPHSQLSYGIDFSKPLPQLKKAMRGPNMASSIGASDFERYLQGQLSPESLRKSGLFRSKISHRSQKIFNKLKTLEDPFLSLSELDLNGLEFQRTLADMGYHKKLLTNGDGRWLPISIWGRPQELKVEWIYRDNWRLTEPFFLETVAHRKPYAPRKSTPAEQLIKTSTDLPEPSGFIFHASRCGSTLLGQMLKRRADVMMLSEPIVFENLLNIPSVALAQKTALLLGLMNAYSAARLKTEKRLFVKFSGGTNWLPWLTRLYPQTPWIYLYRKPDDVIRSNLNGPPAWLTLITGEAARQNALEKKYEAQLDTVIAHAKDAALIANYSEINRDFPARLLKALRLPVTNQAIRLMASALDSYSKSPEQRWDQKSRNVVEQTYKPLVSDISPSLVAKYKRLEDLRLELFYSSHDC